MRKPRRSPPPCHSDRKAFSPVIPTSGASGGILRASVSHKYRLHSAIQKDFVTKAQRARLLDCARGDRGDTSRGCLFSQKIAGAVAPRFSRVCIRPLGSGFALARGDKRGRFALARGDRVEGIKKHLRKQNHAFAPAHTICREARGGKVNAPRVLKKGVPSNARGRGKPRG